MGKVRSCKTKKKLSKKRHKRTKQDGYLTSSEKLLIGFDATVLAAIVL